MIVYLSKIRYIRVKAHQIPWLTLHKGELISMYGSHPGSVYKQTFTFE